MILKNKKAFYFTLDALFSLLILITIISVIPYTGISFKESQYKTSYLQEDALNLLSTIRTSKVNNYWINQALLNQTYNETLYSGDTLIETISKLWATNYLEDAKNITAEFFGSTIEPKDNFGIFFRTEEGLDMIFIRNHTKLDFNTDETEDIVSIRRYISGVEKGQNLTGFTARAFLQKKERTKIVYFGGYVGDGNITAVVDLPNITEIKNISLELAPNIASELYINNHPIQKINASSDELIPITVYLSSSTFNNITNGTNIFEFKNASQGTSPQLLSISGGYIKIIYETNYPEYISIKRQYFPGIEGAINEYDSIYAPNTIKSMNARLHYSVNLSENQNKTTLFLKIGNITVYNHTINESISDFSVDLSDSNISSLIEYDSISNQTIPIRMGFTEFAGSTGEGIADIVIITDISGSMAWSMGEDNVNSPNDFPVSQCGNLSNPNNKIFWSNNSRMSLARCLNIEFATAILDIPGNRIGLVAYEAYPPIRSFQNLTSNLTLIVNGSSGISRYTRASGGTAICAGIRKAKQMLRDLGNDTRRKFILVMTDGLANYQCDDVNNESLDVCKPYDCTSSNTHCLPNYGYGCLYRVFPIFNSLESRGEIFNLSLPISSPDALVVGESNNKRGYEFINGRWINNSEYISGFTSLGYTATIFNLTGDEKLNLITSTFSNTAPLGYTWNGTGWTSENIVSGLPTRQVVGEIVYDFNNNGKFSLFAGNSTGYISSYEWNGTGWNLNTSITKGIGDQGTNVFPAIAFNVTGDENWTMIIGRTTSISPVGFYWNGTSWKSKSAYINGLSGEVDTEYGYTPDFEYNLTNNRWYILLGARYLFVWDSGKWYKTCGDYVSDHAADQAISEASKVAALTNFNKTYAIGFGPIEYCPFAQQEMKDIAETGNGSYLVSKNSTQLRDMMKKWAEDIASLSYSEQRVNVTGNFSSRLYSNSYIEYDYDPIQLDLGNGEPIPTGQNFEESLGKYGNIITYESPLFNNSRTTFNFSEGIVLDVIATSYSGPKWTKYVSINNSNTNGFETVFNLTVFGSNFGNLGDPFRVNIPANKVDYNNGVELKIANSSLSGDEVDASNYDKVIYTLLILSNYSYSNITEEADGCDWTIEYYDGTQENIVIPGDYTGNNKCYYNHTYQQGTEFNCTNSIDIIKNDAIAQATYMVLRNYLDKNPNDCRVDIKISDYYINVLLLPSVPFLKYTTAEILSWR